MVVSVFVVLAFFGGIALGGLRRKVVPEPASVRETYWKALAEKVAAERDTLAKIAAAHSIVWNKPAEADSEWVTLWENYSYTLPFERGIELLKRDVAAALKDINPSKLCTSLTIDAPAEIAPQLARKGWVFADKSPMTGDKKVRIYTSKSMYVASFQDQIDAIMPDMDGRYERAGGADALKDIGGQALEFRLSVQYRVDTPRTDPEVRFVEVPVAVTTIQEMPAPLDETGVEAATIAAKLEVDPALAEKVERLRAVAGGRK